MSPSNAISYTLKVSSTRLTKHELNKNNRHATVDKGKTTWSQPYTQNYRQLRNAEWEEPSSAGKRTPMVIQYPMVGPAHMHIIQTEWVHLGIYT